MAAYQQHHRHHPQQQPARPASSPPAAAFDPETSPIPGQQAWAVLDLHGKMVRSSAGGVVDANNTNDIPPLLRDAPTLYGMLVESTPLVEAGNGLIKMTVDFSASLRYVVARDDHHVYLVQTKGL
mmetsp:Transcript_9747/g.20401  ORF Transcript_9747/g.20401 Transcript_9747/m.20401 type:complete len:125 (+) Transcript_9747:337-711(+)|eukprot:CAMPEP_0201118484 /NCGR_PEP_ID=MMETSP0850-20130426/2682_1 /ASSEMBLY_ACC=CAM_ASM_000622 /TAXON_ID=183588 /ORGANISM="Pseudo-nitzschia fraudulenta, Strain WWA7" /LENGTH=124 /DNA_ID=CAMNT_0047383743 /DNA_START=128 /DNA_END=502 /DNA_ORIENTATION=+